MEEVDVFVTDPTTLDLEVYDLWLKGFTGWLCQYLLCFFFNHHVHVRNKLGGGGEGVAVGMTGKFGNCAGKISKI